MLCTDHQRSEIISDKEISVYNTEIEIAYLYNIQRCKWN